MKILFFGDSITDASRKSGNCLPNEVFGVGFVVQVAGRLYEKSPTDYDIVNRGISGNRIVDLYARIKKDVWNESPDLISLLVGVNDVWHEINYDNGVDIERFERVYRMLIEDTKRVLPDVKFILCEPFVTRGCATNDSYSRFLETKKYAKVVKKLADEYKLYFLPLQTAFDEAYERYGEGVMLFDGVHPSVQGATLLANEWMKLFNKIEKEIN